MAADKGNNISAEMGPADVAQIPDGLEHRTMRRLCDVQVAHYSSMFRRQAVTHKKKKKTTGKFDSALCKSTGLVCGCIGGWGHCPPDKDQTAAEIENSGSDGIGWVVEVNVRVTSDQEITSKQVAMLQKIGEFIQEKSMSRFVLFAGRRSIHTEEVDRLRGSEGELGELK